MRKLERLYLKPGDLCVVNKGSNKEHAVVVVGVLDEFIAVKPANRYSQDNIEVFNYKSVSLCGARYSREYQGV